MGFRMPLEVDILDEVEALVCVDVTTCGLLDTTVGLEEAIPFRYLEGTTRPRWICQ